VPLFSRKTLWTCAIVAAVLVPFHPGSACAQTVEDRARAAAAAARAKSGDSEALRRNYVTPGLAGEPVATVDDSRTFIPAIACARTANLLEVMVQPAGTGDLGQVTITRDTNLDGTFDQSFRLPVPVSGICANGVLSCEPGTWEQCTSYRWDADQAGGLNLARIDMSALAGCYCINASCGSNLAWANMASVLRDLGGGIIGALTTADPRYGIAEAVIDGPVIRYTGAQSTACVSGAALPQAGYRANATLMASDAFAASNSSPVFQALKSSAIGTGTTLASRHCRIERRITVLKPRPDEVITRISGGYATRRDGGALDFLMGSPSDNSLTGASCSLVDFRMSLRVSDPDRITDARLTHFFADDWAQVRIDGQLIGSGPTPWTSHDLPPGTCELKRTFHSYPDLDLRPFLSRGDHEVWLRVAVAREGEGFAQIHVEVDDSCRTAEQLVDSCAAIASDLACKLENELVDGVQTWLGGIASGLRPLPQRRLVGGSSCPAEITRDFFQKDRTYRCTLDSLARPDTSRGTYIIDHSTEGMLADRIRQPGGGHAAWSRGFRLPDRGSVAMCEPVCKTRARKANDAAAPDGIIAAKQNVPSGYDTFFHACTTADACPLGPGEELVSPCGCIDDFPEAAAMMQSLRLAGLDMVCTSRVP
jgi:hypothetical protein